MGGGGLHWASSQPKIIPQKGGRGRNLIYRRSYLRKGGGGWALGIFSTEYHPSERGGGHLLNRISSQRKGEGEFLSAYHLTEKHLLKQNILPQQGGRGGHLLNRTSSLRKGGGGGHLIDRRSYLRKGRGWASSQPNIIS